MPIMLDPRDVKARSESMIRHAGGTVCAHPPILDLTAMRSTDEAAGRTVVMHALYMICLRAPVVVIRDWIFNHELDSHLTQHEGELLTHTNSPISRADFLNLHWQIESTWALLWAGGMVAELSFDRNIENFMASLQS